MKSSASPVYLHSVTSVPFLLLFSPFSFYILFISRSWHVCWSKWKDRVFSGKSIEHIPYILYASDCKLKIQALVFYVFFRCILFMLSGEHPIWCIFIWFIIFFSICLFLFPSMTCVFSLCLSLCLSFLSSSLRQGHSKTEENWADPISFFKLKTKCWTVVLVTELRYSCVILCIWQMWSRKRKYRFKRDNWKTKIDRIIE